MTEYQLRKEAIWRYENGESPKAIYQNLGKSKAWFFKWLKRYQSEGRDWAKSQSRKPHRTRQTVDKTMEQAVIDTRKSLEGILYAQVGAVNISWQLEQQGLTPPPLSTINSILKRNELVRKRARYQPKGIDYPAPMVTKSNDLHQLDIVGPRYLRDDGRFYSVNVIDAYDRRCNVNPMRRKNNIAMLEAIVRSWQTLGIPVFLQMDNTLSARGSNRYPRSFGLIIRLCLHIGVQPVFIPIQEPWRNGIIERFQDVFDKMFFRSQFFPIFNHVIQQSRGFEKFHDKNHRYSTLEGKTPSEKCSGDIQRLPEDFVFPKKLSIEPGYIHLIRFIRSNLILDVFGEKFPMPREAEYEYVWASIDTTQDKLIVKHDSTTLVEFNYKMPKTIMALSKIDL